MTYLPCDLMTKVDIASMAHALECRQPFLDYRVVEFAASLPVAWKYRRGHGKRILRRAFGDLLPQDIWTRRKMGFGVPLEHWFRDELRPLTHDVLLAKRPAVAATFVRNRPAAGRGARARPGEPLLSVMGAAGVGTLDATCGVADADASVRRRGERLVFVGSGGSSRGRACFVRVRDVR